MSLKKYAWHVFNVNTMVQELMLWVDVDYGISKTTSVLLPGSVDRRSAISVKDFTCALLTVSGGSMSAASPKKSAKTWCAKRRTAAAQGRTETQHQARQATEVFDIGSLMDKGDSSSPLQSVIWPYGLGCLTLHSC